MNKYYYIGIIVFIAGLLVGFVLGRTPDEDDSATESDDDKAQAVVEGSVLEQDGKPNPTLVADGNVVNVKDQEASSQVFLSRVDLAQSGWAAIREFSDGELGNILGARRFDVGVHQGNVTLLRSTVAGQKYIAVLYADDGDKKFDFTRDSLLLDSEGKTVSMVFEAY